MSKPSQTSLILCSKLPLRLQACACASAFRAVFAGFFFPRWIKKKELYWKMTLHQRSPQITHNSAKKGHIITRARGQCWNKYRNNMQSVNLWWLPEFNRRIWAPIRRGSCWGPALKPSHPRQRMTVIKFVSTTAVAALTAATPNCGEDRTISCPFSW